MVAPDSTSNPIMAVAVRYSAPPTPVYQLAWGLRLFSLGRSEERGRWYDAVCDQLERDLGKGLFDLVCQELQTSLKASGLWGPRKLAHWERATADHLAQRETRAGRRFQVCRAISDVIGCINHVETEPAMQQLLTQQAEGLRRLFLIENDGDRVRTKPPEVVS
jgi:hypothetical protein